jgi:hypothetical protein
VAAGNPRGRFRGNEGKALFLKEDLMTAPWYGTVKDFFPAELYGPANRVFLGLFKTELSRLVLKKSRKNTGKKDGGVSIGDAIEIWKMGQLFHRQSRALSLTLKLSGMANDGYHRIEVSGGFRLLEL